MKKKPQPYAQPCPQPYLPYPQPYLQQYPQPYTQPAFGAQGEKEKGDEAFTAKDYREAVKDLVEDFGFRRQGTAGTLVDWNAEPPVTSLAMQRHGLGKPKHLEPLPPSPLNITKGAEAEASEAAASEAAAAARGSRDSRAAERSEASQRAASS